MGIRMTNIATPMPQLRAKFTSKLGIPLSGCKVYTYEPNSNIPKKTWIDIDKAVENTNPILLDAAGEADIFLDGLYRIVVKDRFGFIVYDVEKTGAHTEWDASFVTYSGVTQERINDGLESIANMLAIENPKDGMRVFVKGYYPATNFALAQPWVGGGWFIYDSTKAATSNDVTVFDGWVRDLSGNLITTDDAGILRDSETDQTVKMQALASAVSGINGITVAITTKVLVSSNIKFNYTPDIKIIGFDGVISAKEYRDSFVFTGIGSDNKGIIQLTNCPRAFVYSVEVVGAKQHNFNAGVPEIWEDGDAGIALHQCDNADVVNCKTSHTMCWGILATRTKGATARNNDVSDVVRQSGISLLLDSGSDGTAVDNTIYNVGLYGLEWEIFAADAPAYNNTSYGNNVKFCQKGEAVVRTVAEFESFGNHFEDCREGLSVTEANTVTKKLKFSGNTVLNCHDSLVYANTTNLDVSGGNVFEVQAMPAFIISSAYNSVQRVTGTRTFVVLDLSNITAGSNISIDGVQYSVVSVNIISDTTYGRTNSKEITVDKDLPTLPPYVQVLTENNGESVGAISVGTNDSVSVHGNTFKGLYSAYKTDTTYASGSTTKENYVGNIVDDCQYLNIINTVTHGVKYSNNIIQNSAGLNILSSIGSDLATITPSLYGFERFRVFNSTAHSNNNKYFYLDRERLYVGAIITFDNNSQVGGSGSIVAFIDDAVTGISKLGSSLQVINAVYATDILTKGNHTFRLYDTVGGFSYTSCSIDLLFI